MLIFLWRKFKKVAIDRVIIHKGTFYPSEHLFIYREFKKRSLNKITISFDIAREIMKRRKYPIPRQLHYAILEEMEFLNLIRRTGSSNGKNIQFELIGKDIDKLLNRYNLPV